MSSPLIEFEDVWKIYELGDLSVTALAGVSIAIGRGERRISTRSWPCATSEAAAR